MFKLDLSVLREHGFRINQLRLFHSKKLRGMNFMKNKKVCTDVDDLTGEKNLITEYLVEGSEIDYTSYIIFICLTFISLLVTAILFFMVGNLITMIPLFISFIFYILSKKSYTSFVMGNMGIEMSESFFDFKIRNKYNTLNV